MDEHYGALFYVWSQIFENVCLHVRNVGYVPFTLFHFLIHSAVQPKKQHSILNLKYQWVVNPSLILYGNCFCTSVAGSKVSLESIVGFVLLPMNHNK